MNIYLDGKRVDKNGKFIENSQSLLNQAYHTNKLISFNETSLARLTQRALQALNGDESLNSQEDSRTLNSYDKLIINSQEGLKFTQTQEAMKQEGSQALNKDEFLNSQEGLKALNKDENLMINSQEGLKALNKDENLMINSQEGLKFTQAQERIKYEFFNPLLNDELFNPLLADDKNYAYILERPGPDCIKSGINLRIPEGRYEAQWHSYGLRKNTLDLYNNFVSFNRHILIHKGNTPKDSQGCLLINDDFMDRIDDIIFQKKSISKEESFAKSLKNDFAKKILGKSINKLNDFVKEYVEVRIRNKFSQTQHIKREMIQIYNKEGVHLFSLERKNIKESKLKAKELYEIKGIQWFETSADNYHKLLYVNEKLKDKQECQSLGVLYFTWKEVVEFALIDRYSFQYNPFGNGNWKNAKNGAKGYILVSMEGIPYWADAVGQIPFAINIYKGFLQLTQNKVKAKNATINVGYAFSEGKIEQIKTFVSNFMDNLCFKDDIYDETLNPPTDKNSYDNKMILRGINYGMNPYMDLALDSTRKAIYE